MLSTVRKQSGPGRDKTLDQTVHSRRDRGKSALGWTLRVTGCQGDADDSHHETQHILLEELTPTHGHQGLTRMRANGSLARALPGGMLWFVAPRGNSLEVS